MAQGFADHLIPRAAALGFGFDVFVEAGAFGIKEAEVMLAAAQRRNMRIHVHADQLSATGATGLAARYGAASAEHLEFASAADIQALAAAGTMANLLPGAWLQTGCATRPPVDRLRAAGVPFIVSTDLNPGSSYLYDLITAASLAISAFGLTVDEALAAITTHPARALGVSELGGLSAGERGRPWWLPFPERSRPVSAAARAAARASVCRRQRVITAHRAARIYGHGADHDGGVLRVSSDGVILEVSAQAEPGDHLVDHPNAALIPGGVNVHNHSFQALLRGLGDDLPFLEWRARGLYKYGADLKPDLIYLGALLAFGEMLRSGTTTVCDFFYVHDDGLENDRAVLRAADELGIRCVMARTLYDWDGAPPRFESRSMSPSAGPKICATRSQATHCSAFNRRRIASTVPAPT